ncbi:MAG TPA: ABC transporter ATP-binding protein [Candidatus Polarisedimenticolaceae bacterium]|nr:ABC transporter ATP-binding protein [Candidatus Polarisedimenticolaceae bacterium]
MAPLLAIENLHVRYDDPRGEVRAVDGLDLILEEGETYALVGESGCGKTATAYSVLRVVEPGRITGGKMIFGGRDLMGLTEREMRRVRGAEIGLAFQEAGAALNPVLKIGTQVGESLRIHRGLSRKDAWREAVRLLGEVALPDPERQASSYAHELSGGMKQRAMLAIALSCRPRLLIADEPTSALDLTIQAQILALLRTLKADRRLTVLLITHDFGVVAEIADRVGVMYAGRLVEEAPVREIFARPRHPYTQALLAAIPEDAGDGRGKRLRALAGQVPDPVAYPAGCRFHPRCPEAFAPCGTIEPPNVDLEAGCRVACHLYGRDA